MNNKGSRVTIYDIAQALNISPSTVTRSLNNQTCISEETRKLVHETANRLGYRKNMLAHGLKAKPAKIGLILRNRFPEFQNLIAAGAKNACNLLADFNASIEVSIVDVNDFDNRLLVKIAEMADGGCDGVIFAPPNAPFIPSVDALIREKGIKAATVFHDPGISSVDFFVSADNRISGRTAANLFHVAGLKKGDLVVYFTGHRNLTHHKENYGGFMEMNEEYGFNVCVLEHQDNGKIAYYATEQVLLEQPGLKGIFCSTAVVAPVCEKIIEAGRAGDIFLIGTELLTNCLPYIDDGTIDALLFQNPYKMGYLAYRNMYDCINGTNPPAHAITINPQIVMKGNVAYYEKRITNIDADA